jgi:hypothetical protein
MAVVQKLADVGSAGAHALEPWLCEPPELVIGHCEPGFDGLVSPNGAREQKEHVHRAILPACLAMSKWVCR